MLQSIWKWPKGPFWRLAVFFGCLLFYPLVWGFILGQVVLVVFFLLSLAVWAICRERDTLAGAVLGLTTIKPNLVFLVIPGILIWAIYRRRYSLVKSTFATFGVLVVLPLLAHPNWPGAFLSRLFEYREYSPFPPPAIVFFNRCCPGQAEFLGGIAIFFLILMTGFEWVRAARTGGNLSFLSALGITLITTTAVAPRIAVVNQVVLLFPMMAALTLICARGRGSLAFLLGVLWVGGPWVMSWLPPVSTAEPRYPIEHLVLSPALPVTLGLVWIGLLLTGYWKGMDERPAFPRSLSPGTNPDGGGV
jgi:hypothetical protein